MEPNRGLIRIRGMSRDAEAALKLAELLRNAPADPLEQALELGKRVPEDFRRLRPADLVKYLRRRTELTQRQLARLSGLPHSKVARIEAGQDVRLSTFYQVMAGLGCGLILLPSTSERARDFWRRSDLWMEGHIPRRRRYPRK